MKKDNSKVQEQKYEDGNELDIVIGIIMKGVIRYK